MKQKRRFSLALSILLPTTLALVLGLAGIYTGAYFVIRDSAKEASINDDRNDLTALCDILLDQGSNLIGYGCTPVVSQYESVKPSGPLTPDSQEEKDYRRAMEQSTFTQLYSACRDRLERFVTTFVGIFYEDTAENRLVLVCSSDITYPSSPLKETSLYIGSFFEKPSYAVEEGFYGYEITDRYLGPMLVSGKYLCEASYPVQSEIYGGPYRYWVLRETQAEDIYDALPRFRQNFAIVASILLVVLIATMFLLLYFLVIRPLRRLSKNGNAYVEGLKSGELMTIFKPDNHHVLNEIGQLNDSLFFTQEAIAGYAQKVRESAAFEEKINADLALAERIQSSMVPSAPLIGDNYLIRGTMIPAKEVGGDLYNYFKIDEDNVGFFIGDVSGKGVPAALFMAKTNMLLRLGLKDLDIDEKNKVLCEDNVENFFVTAFLAVLNVKTGMLHYVNCGHEPVFICHNGVYEALEEDPNFMLGCIEDFHFIKQQRQLYPGDRLFLYTDGVSEAMDVDGNLFGKQRILNALNANANLPSEQNFHAMWESVASFVGKAEQSDDACMVALDYIRERTLAFDATLEGFRNVEPFVDEFLAGKDFTLVSQIQVILDELCSNVVHYSRCGDKPVILILRDDGVSIQGTLADEGIPFDPLTDKPDRDPDKPGGLGIITAQSMLDEISHSYVAKRNILSFRKNYGK